jgi:hypothetical protein
MARGEFQRTTLSAALAEDLQRVLEDHNDIPRSNLPPRPVPGRPTEDPNYVFVYNDGRSPAATEDYDATPEADLVQTAPVSEATDAYEEAHDDYEDDDGTGTELLVAKVVPDGPADDEIAKEKPSHRRRNALIALGALAATAIVALGINTVSAGMSADEKANLVPTVPTDTATASPIKQGQHKHKHKPAHGASQAATPETEPTSSPSAEPSAPTTPDSLINPEVAPVPTGPTSLRIGYLDVYTNKNKEDETYSIDKWQERLAKSTHVIRNHLDIAALGDVREEQFDHLTDDAMLGSGYSISPAKYSAFSGRSPIVYRNDIYSVVDEQTLSGPRPADTDRHQNAINVLRLHNNQTNQDLTVINGSLPDGRDKGAYEARAEYAELIAEIAGNIESHSGGVPVFVLADMSDNPNSKPTKGGNFTANQLDDAPYCTLTSIGQLENAYVAAHSQSEVDRRGECTRDERMPADQVFTSTGVSIDSYSDDIGPRRNGSKNGQLIEVGATIPVDFAQVIAGTQGVTGAS